MSPVLKSLNPYRQKLNIILGVFGLTLLLFVIVSIIDLNDESYSEQIINEVFYDIETDLLAFFSSVENKLHKTKSDYKQNNFDLKKLPKLKNYFSSILNNSDEITSIFLGDSKGQQFLMYRDKNTWISGTRVITENENRIEWKRCDDSLKLITEWVEIIDYDPREEEWFNNLNIAFNDSITLTQTHQFFTTKQFGTTAVIIWEDINQQDTIYLAANISLETLKKEASKLNKYSNRKLFLLTENDRYINIPEKGDSALTKFNAFLNSSNHIYNEDINFILSEWKKLGSKVEIPFSFSKNDDLWWNRIEVLDLKSTNLRAGISITESALNVADNYYRYFLYIGMVIITILQIVIVVIYLKKRKAFQNMLDETQVWKDYSVDEVNSILRQGENNSVEFKSSLRWDYHEEKVNKHLEEVILKSVAAFNNGEGGTLVIGVDDDSNVLGLEKDCLSLKKKNIDYFEIHIRNLFNQIFGINFTTTNLKISFPKYEDKVICVIEIMKGNSPIFLTLTDTKGRRTENFFIRSGNTSQKVESLTEINNYISKRFNSSSSL